MPDTDPLAKARGAYERWQRERPPGAEAFTCWRCHDLGLMWVEANGGGAVYWKVTPCCYCEKGRKRGFEPSRHPESAMTFQDYQDRQRELRSR